MDTALVLKTLFYAYRWKKEVGQRPWNLFDYFPKDFLLFVDESTYPLQVGVCITIVNVKRSIGEYGFRLPSALENRPIVMNSSQ